MRKFMLRQLVGILLFWVGIAWMPHAWNARLAERWFTGDPVLQTQLANGMEEWIRGGLDRDDFTTGSKQFDGEWLYGTYVMAAMGFGQMGLVQEVAKNNNFEGLITELSFWSDRTASK